MFCSLWSEVARYRQFLGLIMLVFKVKVILVKGNFSKARSQVSVVRANSFLVFVLRTDFSVNPLLSVL